MTPGAPARDLTARWPRTDLAKAAAFYAITFTLVFSVAAFSPFPSGATQILSMATPLVALLLMLYVVTRDGRTAEGGWRSLGVLRAGRGIWWLAVLGPLAVLSATYAVTWAAGVGEFVVPEDTPLALVPADVLIGIVIGTAFAFGEEIGWRGYLLPRLASLGRTRALLLTGALQGLFHLPLILLTDFYHPEGDRLIVVPLFVLTLTAAGIFFGYLRLASGSVWPSALAHGAFNTFWNLFTRFTVSSSPVTLEYLAGESGLLMLIATAGLGVLLLRWRPLPA